MRLLWNQPCPEIIQTITATDRRSQLGKDIAEANCGIEDCHFQPLKEWGEMPHQVSEECVVSSVMNTRAPLPELAEPEPVWDRKGDRRSGDKVLAPQSTSLG